MIPGTFAYHRPTTIDSAVALLIELGEDARPLAGGHSLIPLMKTRLASPEHLVDLTGIEGLNGIERSDGDVVIGAMTTQHSLIGSSLLSELVPIVRETSLMIADPQIRYKGTIGGNCANGDPGNDMPALMQCLNARYALTGNEGTREVAARNFYLGAYETVLAAGEILTAVRIPIPAPGHGYAYEKLKRKVGDYATAAAAVMITMAGDTCTSASIGLTNVAETPLWAEEAGRLLVGTKLDEGSIASAVAAAEAITDPASDMRGPADYRTKMAGVMLRRALERARSRAKA
ncbi:xanthine dehydrogenase family protein subunit M [Rhizobium sp. TRM96647]|uniref:FAD binding domain-containing protein n=1 Tax=unclassified Rhizobium TaxID=2613769 RepID=UPI0021E99E34|nr:MULTISPECIES: xanthine dehydrogenase family protein subunit M [unclassified Rhizobium]MCV3736243.1 xanthine dehydrogenase family protein subunit M [Rhizobium sp. TRM96647]MCV3758095.1 xanthine dehydrogenase family protein subunit M [Rhizobium sp. TRM96650]